MTVGFEFGRGDFILFYDFFHVCVSFHNLPFHVRRDLITGLESLLTLILKRTIRYSVGD